MLCPRPPCLLLCSSLVFWRSALFVFGCPPGLRIIRTILHQPIFCYLLSVLFRISRICRPLGKLTPPETHLCNMVTRRRWNGFAFCIVESSWLRLRLYQEGRGVIMMSNLSVGRMSWRLRQEVGVSICLIVLVVFVGEMNPS